MIRFIYEFEVKGSLFCLKYYHSKLQGRESSETEANFPFETIAGGLGTSPWMKGIKEQGAWSGKL